MKKWICLILCLVLAASLSGCSGNPSAASKTSTSAAPEITTAAPETTELPASADSEMSEAPETELAGESEAAETEVPAGTDGQSGDIDVDLTRLSSTMVYSEVYNMMADPETYIGKTIKMAGQYTSFHSEDTGLDYFACIIQDATACCSQGLEFILTEEYAYPEDYPEEGAVISVVGVFDTYEEGEYTYCTLRNARLV